MGIAPSDAGFNRCPNPAQSAGVLLHPPCSSELGKITLVIKRRIFFGHFAATRNNHARKRFKACPGTLHVVFWFDSVTVQNRNTDAPALTSQELAPHKSSG